MMRSTVWGPAERTRATSKRWSSEYCCIHWAASHNYERLPAAGPQETHQDTDQGRLAGAVGTQETEDLAARNLEVNGVERLGRPVPLAQCLHPDGRRRSHACRLPQPEARHNRGVKDLPAYVAARVRELAPESRRLLVAVSGGGDSVALLHALAASQAFELVVGHLDHALRPDSGQDVRFARDLAARLGAEFVTERIDVGAVAKERGWNVEDAARRVRYAFLARAAKRNGCQAVVTAHTRDDQAETVLLQLLRGAAYATGMRPVQRNVIRPLLEVRSRDLRDYLREQEIGWREDASNQDRSYRRAWLRHEVLPLLGERVPHATTALARHAAVQSDIADFMRESGGRLLDGSGASTDRLLAAHPALQREALAQLIARDGGQMPDLRRIEEVRSRLGDRHPYRMSLAPGLTLRIAYGRVEVVRKGRARPAAGARTPVADAAQLPPGVAKEALQLDGLVYRTREPGDRMRLPGGTKKLSRLLVDRKIPREERDALRVLASGSQVVWAERIGPAAPYAIREPAAGAHGDERFMRLALAQAREAGRKGELPVGAVLVRDGEPLGVAHNETEASNDPTAHAELLAIRRAAASQGDWRLQGATLYVTLEPCPMCTGALLSAHVERVVYGAANRREGALGTVTDLNLAGWKRRLDVSGGVLGREAGELLTRFFSARRE